MTVHDDARRPDAPPRGQLEVDGLHVAYRSDEAAPRQAVDGVSFRVAAGETLGLVGESGSGKSTVALAIARALPPTATVAGRISFDGADLTELDGSRLREWWRTDFAMVFQEPQAALNPTMRVGSQVAEVLRSRGADRSEARSAAVSLLGDVAITDAEAVARRYPHELSGGQQQRVVIAMALAIRPRLLVLDEPTTGLDATVERGILQLIADMRRELSSAVLFITHDLGLVEQMCDRVTVLRDGCVEEHGDVQNVLVAPSVAYTRQLLRDAMTPDRTKHDDPALVARSGGPDLTRAVRPDPLIRVRGVVKRYSDVIANDGIDLTIGRGEIVGLVGESGSGKTTLGRVIAGLTVPDEGSVELGGATLAADVRHRRPEQRRAIQVVFQSPDSTLNPRHRVREVLARAIKMLSGHQSIDDLASACRIDSTQLSQLTATLSGGQKQRVAIARAIAGEPSLVVCDEPVSALDVTVQATILRLLVELQRERNVSMLFVSHDLGVVRYVSDRIAVMYAGRIVEEGPCAEVLAPPFHPYTAELLAASEHRDLGDGGRTPIPARAATAADRRGCAFAPRCPQRIDGICDVEPPPVRELAAGLRIRCHLPTEPHTVPTDSPEPPRLQSNRAQ